MKKHLLILLLAFLTASAATAQQQPLPEDAVRPDWEGQIPQIVFPDTALITLYGKTWEIAAGRVRRGPEGLPASPYLDENCYEDQIWIWDTCFMTLFSKYCPTAFPGKESLLNCYVPIHENRATPLRIHLRDNPPLFAWVESEYYRFTGDRAQAEMVTQQKKYLQKHFDWFNTIPKGEINPLVSPEYNPIHRDVVRDGSGRIVGYTWSGRASGMDNTVRGRDCGGYDSILWVDAICQQALAALSISRLARDLGDEAEAACWQTRYDSIKQTVNELYWDERDGFYYDISVRTHEPCRVKTPASFWAMLAEIPSKEQAARMVRYVETEKGFGGRFPWNSLSRDDPDYDAATGEYWRGGVWLPIAYMGTKALERYGYTALADTLAARVVRQQLRTYLDYVPHTVWETYSPSSNAPSTEYGKRVRPDFCGWSALGPISLCIENVLGFRKVDATRQKLTWDLNKRNGTHGIRRFRFAGIEADIIYNAATDRIEISTDRPFTLEVNGHEMKVKKGKRMYKVPTK